MKFFMLLWGILGIVGALNYIFITSDEDPDHPAFSDLALRTDNLLKYAKEDISKNYYGTSLVHIEKAIEMMEKIETDADQASDVAIENAIRYLELLEKEIVHGNVVDSEVNHAFANALNALAYAHLRISENCLDNQDHNAAVEALKYAIEHIDNAMHYSKGNEKDVEMHVLREIDSLMLLEYIDPDLFKENLHRLLMELDTCLVHVQ